MAINIQYGPPAGLTAMAAFGVGQGQLARYNSEVARDNYWRARQMGLQESNAASAQQARAQGMAMDALRGQQAQQMAQQRAEFQAAADESQMVDKQINDFQSGISKASMQGNLTPEGRQIYNKLFGDLQAIEKADYIRPQQRIAARRQWLANAMQSGLQENVIEPPSFSDWLKENSAPVSYNPDGSIATAWVRDRSGAPKFVDLASKRDVEAIRQGSKEREAFVKVARDEVVSTEKRIIDLPAQFAKSAKPIQDAILDATIEQAKLESTKVAEYQKAAAEMEKKRLEKARVTKGLAKDEAVPRGEYELGEQDLADVRATVDARIEAGKKAYQNTIDKLRQQETELQQRYEQESVAAARAAEAARQKYGAAVEGISDKVQSQGPPAPPPPPGVAAPGGKPVDMLPGDMPEPAAQNAPVAQAPDGRMLPLVTSNAAYLALPPGTEFVDPQGQVRRKP